MRIDVHAHYWTDDYLDLLAGLGKTDTGTQRGPGAGGGEELDARLRLMDRARWTCRCSPPLRNYRVAKTATRRSSAPLRERPVRALVERHPDRFRAFAATPMPHIDASIAELGRASG